MHGGLRYKIPPTPLHSTSTSSEKRDTTQSFGIDDAVLTYEDYRKTSDEQRYEFLDGELVVLPTPNIAHQVTLGDLLCELYDFLKEKKTGEAFMRVAVVLSDTNVVEPDITFVLANRMDIVGVDDIQGVPDLIVEVISPSDPERDLVRKRGIYARQGIAEYWIADPEARSILVMTLDGATYRVAGEYGTGDTLISRTLRDLRLEVGEVFGGLDLGSTQGA